MEARSFFENLDFSQMVRIVISDRLDKTNSVEKIVLSPKRIKESNMYQITSFVQQKVLHKNILATDLFAEINPLIYQYKQCLVQMTEVEYQVFFNEGNLKILTKNNRRPLADLTHNQSKKYILEDGKFVPFFYELKVMDLTGKVNPTKYNKFRQINRYLEFIRDILYLFPVDKPLKIIDFGCGKSYLTFACYYYLHDILGYQVEIIGLDLKADVIQFCNELARKCHMDNLKFQIGNIGDYESIDNVDLVFSLHACDTATDYAIAKAVKYQAKVIMAVPCCQHEVNQQIESKNLPFVLEQGIIKERLAALITDVARHEILGAVGYKSQIIEFIETEHTPKNLLIKAIRSKGDKTIHRGQYNQLKTEYGFELTLAKLLEKEMTD